MFLIAYTFAHVCVYEYVNVCLCLSVFDCMGVWREWCEYARVRVDV